MPTDLIGHLRMSCELAHDKSVSPTCLWCQAADEIERLREQVQGAEDVIAMLLEEARRG